MNWLNRSWFETSISAQQSFSLQSWYLYIGREGEVDLLPVGSDSVQKQRVVHGAVPRCLKPVESSAM